MWHVPVREEHRTQLSEPDEKAMKDPDLRKRVNVPRSKYPATTHVDYSARLQTVDPERHGRFYRLMKAFEALTGGPSSCTTTSSSKRTSHAASCRPTTRSISRSSNSIEP